MTDEEIYRKYSDDLTRFATGLVGPFDAPDVVTDACLRAFNAGAWSTVTNHRAYLYRSVLNQARSHHRSTLRRRIREMRAAQPDESVPVEVDLPRRRNWTALAAAAFGLRQLLASSSFSRARPGTACP